VSLASAALLAPRRRLVLADLLPGARVRDAALVVGAAAFVGVSAQIAVSLPFTPVPLTMQSFAVLLAGATLGLRRGAAGMVLYVLAGLAGMPWFAQHHGVQRSCTPRRSATCWPTPSSQPWSARWPPAAGTAPCCAPPPPWPWGRW